MNPHSHSNILSHVCSYAGLGPIVSPLLEIIANSDRRHGLELDCNQETSLVLDARSLIDFN